ncbi:hypothetical protein [Streptomyces sp. 6N223]|uniref:hypothetical protein n=1 Tax=Streptomyces sp. 6N223 TaxID=3457412 RepID=UPI003FD2EC01
MATDQTRPESEPDIVLTSEFASVRIDVDLAGNGPRLRIENRQNGHAVCLDPLELASLTWLQHRDLGPFLDPSQSGWRNYEEMTDGDG